MADTDDTKATKVAALGGPEASPEASEAKEHALDRKASSDDEADEAEADAAAEPTTDATADEPSSDSPPAAAAAAASAASGAGTSASAAAAVDDADKEEEDKLAIYRTASTAGRGYVVCYGWMTKQGEGGFLRRKSWKRRFFVLYKVPHGSVLVYYNTNKPEADNIMGYVDLRQVTSVSLTRQNIGGSDRDAIEIVTVPRTYYVCPATVQRSVASSSSGSCINILGWPVSELEVTPQYDAEKEGFATQRRVLQTWLKNLEVACKFKAATMHAEVTTETDSTTVLPDKVYIMVTPSDVVLLDGSVKDKAYACWPYRDLASWRAESRKNLQINVRSVSSTIRCTFSVEENVPRDAGGLTFGTTAFELKKRIDEHIQALVELRKAGEKV